MVYLGDVVNIGQLKDLEKAVKRSFSNVRVDIINIKDYLQKHEEIINDELKDLQSQLFESKRELQDKLREFSSKFAERTELRQKIRDQRDEISELREDIKELRHEVYNIKGESETVDDIKDSIAELNKSFSDYKKQIKSEMKDGVSEFENQTKKRTRMFDRRLKKLDRRIKKIDREEPNLLPWIVLLAFLLLAAGVGYWYFFGYNPQPVPQDNMTVIVVNETDFVDIKPNITDPDNDTLNFTFSDPLNESGQWQTEVGDAGTYPITVTVSDGESTSSMQFFLVVKELQP